MAEWVVACGGTAAPDPRAAPVQRLDLDLDGPARNVDLHLHDISRRMAADVSPVLTDLLEIAAYVFAADERISRGGPAMSALGGSWRRRLRFIVPVRRPELWSRPEVRDALTDALGFMSEDDFAFEFVAHGVPAPMAHYFDLGTARGKKFGSDEVLLFSGGMDSLCGAIVELDRNKAKRLLLVSHQSSPKMAAHQKELAAALRIRFPERVFHVPVRVGITDSASREYTQRTRSFLFAAIAATVGVGQHRILFYENGVISFNLPIAGQVVGARASRTTHPRTLQLLERLLGLLLERDFRIENPFIWKTRAEVAALGASAGQAELLGRSVSCSRVRSMERDQPHCGVCSQCIDRRFATLAAGLGDLDAAGGYRVDLLTGSRDGPDDRTMAESYLRHASEVRRMSELGFVSRFANELGRLTRCFQGLTADEAAKRSYELHQRHAAHVINVLTSGISEHAQALAEQCLPESCVLRLAVTSSATMLEMPLPAVEESTPKPGAKSDHRNYNQTSDIEMALVADGHQVVFSGVGAIPGRVTFRLLEQLAETYLQDREAGWSMEDCRFTQAPALAATLCITEESLRRCISRFRRRVAELFDEVCGLLLSINSVIETRGWQGYRLNPRVHLVHDPATRTAATSRMPTRRVTTPASLSGKSTA